MRSKRDVLGRDGSYAFKAKSRLKFPLGGTLFPPAPLSAPDTGEYVVRTILLIILVLLLIGALPTWPYSSGWGYYPSGGLGLVLIILLILVLMGRV
jgi:hypothetical protein